MLEKVVDVTGKSGILAIPVSESLEKLGFIVDADMFQFISAVGVLMLIFDRSVRLYWVFKDRKAKKKLY